MRVLPLGLLAGVLVARPAAADPNASPDTSAVEARTEPTADETSEAPQPASKPPVAGFALAGLGILGLGAAGLLALRSVALHQSAQGECVGDRCSPHGGALRDDALAAGNAAALSGVAGLAALVSGVVIFATDATPPTRPQPRSLHAGVLFFRGAPGITLEGALP